MPWLGRFALQLMASGFGRYGGLFSDSIKKDKKEKRLPERITREVNKKKKKIWPYLFWYKQF